MLAKDLIHQITVKPLHFGKILKWKFEFSFLRKRNEDNFLEIELHPIHTEKTPTAIFGVNGAMKSNVSS